MASSRIPLVNLLRGSRDRMTAGGARLMLNMKLERYGRVDRLELDSQAKTVRLTLRLKGEEDRPVLFAVDGYELFSRDGEWFLKVNTARCERPWLQNALEDFVIGREVKVPERAVGVLRALL